jgi:DNA-directed RNA polymerase specialized sigma24 family protein
MLSRVAGETPKRSIAEVYDDHIWDVYGFFGYRFRSREQAEDLTQVTFERALRAWERFDPERASAKTWLLAIARNVLVDHYRGEGGREDRPLPDGDPPGAKLGTTGPDERGLGPTPELAQALEQLGERERELIALRFGGDMTGAQIAEVTELSLANVQQILSRSLRRLRTELEGAGASERPRSGGERAGAGDADDRDREQRGAGARVGDDLPP